MSNTRSARTSSAFFLLCILALASCSPAADVPSDSPPPESPPAPAPTASPPPPATPAPASGFLPRWARTSANSLGCDFRAVAVDASGNVYAAGIFNDDDTCSFGSGKTVTGPHGLSQNPVVVKYDSAGNALWARTVTALSGQSDYGCIPSGIAVDGTGNVYVAGRVGRGTYAFSPSVSLTMVGTLLSFPVLIKYDAAGNAVWATSVDSATVLAEFLSVCVEKNSSNVYVSGALNGSGSLDFGVPELSSAYAGANPILVKYDATGTALWAKGLSSASGTVLGCEFSAVGSDGSGNALVAGYIQGDGGDSYVFASGVEAESVTGSLAPILVKYSNTGDALWARTVSDGKGQCRFNSIAMDDAGNAYAAGYLYGNGTATLKEFRFAPGVGVWREYVDSAFVVKYGASGTAQWARTVESGSRESYFYGVSAMPSGGIACAGAISGNQLLDFGGGKTAAGGYASGPSILIVRYDASGAPSSAHSATSGTRSSLLYGIAAGPLGTVYGAGYASDAGSWNFGNEVTLSTAEECTHPLLVKFGE